MIAEQLDWARAMLLMAISMTQVYAIVYAVDFEQRADSLVYTYLAESRAPSVAFAVIRGKDTFARSCSGTLVQVWISHWQPRPLTSISAPVGVRKTTWRKPPDWLFPTE